ncbi:putative LysR-family regulatory protein [Xenorhabdus poinarii G6]|uniref:Putative LysR-family regulatory protein n=1 Tax=Xenorhabdus poinarii G6 TaxID=1354304 RepID=A0A068R3Q8_9GAMM|nr:LysR family transcriptional regulator [Xenorhabdus poinarii]CDG21818.1 putative LysR-family regulatory protein [Xenorhabdus poinarii G6]
MDWSDARIFLALCRCSTLRAAARSLGIDQATVGRRVVALEKSLNATLFLRTSGGYALTAIGEVAFSNAEKMEHAALELERQVQGLDERLTGVVRVSTTDSFAIDFLIPAIARLHDKHPDILVQLDASTRMLNLSKREVDIAVRNARPDNPDLIARCLARWPVGLFASKAYVKARGKPELGQHFQGHDLVLFQPHFECVKDLTLVGESVCNGRVVSTLSSSLLVRQSIAAGIGLGELPIYIGKRDGLIQLWPERTGAVLYEVWMVIHADLRHTVKIRAVIDEIVEAFAGPEM